MVWVSGGSSDLRPAIGRIASSAGFNRVTVLEQIVSEVPLFKTSLEASESALTAACIFAVQYAGLSGITEFRFSGDMSSLLGVADSGQGQVNICIMPYVIKKAGVAEVVEGGYVAGVVIYRLSNLHGRSHQAVSSE